MDAGQERVTLTKLYLAGYSFKSNQYGMAIDTVIAYELVKPDGNVVMVTKDSYPTLFFGLKVCLFYWYNSGVC